MNEEEKKAIKVINTRTRRLLDELEIEKEDMLDEPRIAYLMQEIRANKIILNLIERLQKENEELKNAVNVVNKEKADWIRAYQEEKDKQFELLRPNIPVQEVKDLKNRILENEEYTVVLEGDKEFPDNAIEATFEKYINLKVLDELVERK